MNEPLVLTISTEPGRLTGLHDFDPAIEAAIVQRECLERIRVRIAAEQLGEAWAGLDRRRQTTIKRGDDRRKRAA